MPAFTINIPIRTADAEDVKNAFASSYGYKETLEIGGVNIPNPITKEEFVKQKCINFMLDVAKTHIIKKQEIIAREAAEELAKQRAVEVTEWFDNRRLESIGGISVFQNFPQVHDKLVQTNKNESVNFSLTGTDPDDLPLQFQITANPTNGLLSGTSPNYSYTPYNGYFGSDLLKFKATNGLKNSLEGTVTFEILRTLTSEDAVVNVRKNNSIEILLSAKDSVGQVSYQILTQPTGGSISGNNPITYTPNSDFIGNDSFTFTCSDDTLSGTIGTVLIEVNELIAVSETIFVNKNEDHVLNLKTVNSVGEVSFQVLTQPANGTLFTDNQIIYVPNSDFVGTDSFTFIATDVLGESAQATISLQVN